MWDFTNLRESVNSSKVTKQLFYSTGGGERPLPLDEEQNDTKTAGTFLSACHMSPYQLDQWFLIPLALSWSLIANLPF